MITNELLATIKREYGWCSSWAIWAPETDPKHPKSGISDLSIFSRQEIHKDLHVDYVLVGLNISRRPDTVAFDNFHSSSPKGQDYKLRHALQGTPVWGAYMTDIIKDHEDISSENVMSYFRRNPDLLEKHLDDFDAEIERLRCRDARFIALGGGVHKIISRRFGETLDIIKIPHYAMYVSKENYRKTVHAALGLS